MFHVETLNGVVDWSVLLLVCNETFEPLESDDQDRWCLVDLNLLDCLFMSLALVTVPLVLL